MSGFAGEEKKEGGCDIPTMFAPGPSTERGHPSNIDTDPAGNRIIYASGSNIVIQAVLDVRPFLHYRGSHPKPTPPARVSGALGVAGAFANLSFAAVL